MVQDAEDYSEEDRQVKERTDAKNSLEGYLYNVKNVLDDEEGGVASKISEADKEVSARRNKSTLRDQTEYYRVLCITRYAARHNTVLQVLNEIQQNTRYTSPPPPHPTRRLGNTFPTTYCPHFAP